MIGSISDWIIKCWMWGELESNFDNNGVICSLAMIINEYLSILFHCVNDLRFSFFSSKLIFWSGPWTGISNLLIKGPGSWIKSMSIKWLIINWI